MTINVRLGEVMITPKREVPATVHWTDISEVGGIFLSPRLGL